MPPKNSPNPKSPASNKDDSKTPATKTPSPARKSKTKKVSNTFLRNMSSANQVCSKRVLGIEGLAVVLFLKNNGVDPSFNGNVISHIEGSDERLEFCHVTLFSKLRKSDGTNEPAMRANTKGNSYPIDIAVVVTDGEVSVNQACSNLAKTMTKIAKEECKDDFTFGLPLYANRGDTSPTPLLHLSKYLMDYDCITVMKRIFEKTESKEELFNNPDKDEILKIIFGGDGTRGLEVLNGVEEDDYEQL